MNQVTSKTARLIIVCGLSFSGKTTLGTAIAKRFGYEQVDVDNTKVKLLGATFSDNDLDKAEWERIYAETDKQIESYLRSGKSVIDASRYFKREERDLAKQIASRNGADFLTIYVDTPEAVVRERYLTNKQNPTRVDWGDDSFEEIVRVMEPPRPDEHPLVFNYKDNLEEWITKNISL